MTPAEARARLAKDGYVQFPVSPETLRWAQAAHAAALPIVSDPGVQATWLQCEGTWFVGVDVLPNTSSGAIGGVPLDGPFRALIDPCPPLHPAQVSVTYPGYPKPRAGETEAGFRYRRNRDAAHVDGLIAEGPERRRFLREPHQFILGIPLTWADAGASPLVVWQGSHRKMGDTFRRLFKDVPDPESVDVTEAYVAARRGVFDTCPRVALPGTPGAAVLLHPHVVHGVAPWAEGAKAADEGRMIAYFRPIVAGGIGAWLQL